MKKQYIYLTFLVVIISITVVYVFLSLNFSGQSNDHRDQNVNKTIGLSSVVSENLGIDDVIFSISTGHRLRSHHKNQSYFSYQVFSLKTTLKRIFIVKLPDWISHTSILPLYLLTNRLVI